MIVKIDQHSKYDKSFRIYIESPDVVIDVDFDDVNHEEVEAAVTQIAHLLTTNWNPEWHAQLFTKFLLERWEKDEHLREDYECDFQRFLKDSL